MVNSLSIPNITDFVPGELIKSLRLSEARLLVSLNRQRKEAAAIAAENSPPPPSSESSESSESDGDRGGFPSSEALTTAGESGRLEEEFMKLIERAVKSLTEVY